MMNEKEWEAYWDEVRARTQALQGCGFTVIGSVGEDEIAELTIQVQSRRKVEDVLKQHRIEAWKERVSEGLRT